jgi:hypothetical protein
LADHLPAAGRIAGQEGCDIDLRDAHARLASGPLFSSNEHAIQVLADANRIAYESIILRDRK